MVHKLPPWALVFSEQKITDQKLKNILQLPEVVNARWLDFRFNQITRDGIHLLCGSNLPSLEIAEFYGNPCDKLGEVYKTDLVTECIIPESIKLTPFTAELEAKYGYRRWFHPVSEFGDPFPPPTALLRLEPFFTEDESDDEKVTMIWDA